MNSDFSQLIPFFLAKRARQEDLVMAVVYRTEGSTYRKIGALMLIGEDGVTSGLLSGGCLEADIAEHAKTVFADGVAKTLTYRFSDEDAWSLGLGCGGSMWILLCPLLAERDYAPFEGMVAAYRENRDNGLAFVCAGPGVGAFCVRGTTWNTKRDELPELTAQHWDSLENGRARLSRLAHGQASTPVLMLKVPGKVHVLLLGQGPDVAPVVRMLQTMGWMPHVYDHRPLFQPNLAQLQCSFIQGEPEHMLENTRQIPSRVAIVMTHHQERDLAYLGQLAKGEVAMIGLLGPLKRKQDLLARLPSGERDRLLGRLWGPVGIDLGGEGPEAVALSITAQIQAFLHGKQVAGTSEGRPS